ncbi:sulfite exporter TauE/SafE family protein [Bradyrhizobium sp. 2TAF24]|uniref:sulfite exporter TauE/SafE family protein n=1 Tax=Bradyrhizobium sp. 2TAF24 TaxID=3233011 RepID=UPI003F8DA76B
MSLGLLALIAVVVAVAGFVQAAIGVGFALIVAPVMALVAPTFLPGGLLLLMLPLNAFVAWRERRAVDWFGTGWITAGRTAGTFAGYWILVAVSSALLNLLVGAATLLAAVASLLAPKFAPSRPAFLAAGLVTGVTETATGIGGPPLALVYQHHSAAQLRANVALCFLIGEVFSLLLLAASGRLAWWQAGASLLLLPALVLGIACSRFAHALLDRQRLRLFVLGFAIVSGLVLIVHR